MFARMMESPLFVALVGAQFVPYALVAIVVIACRLFGRKLRGIECMFLLLVGLLFAVEGEQLLAVGGKTRDRNTCMALNRYFGVFAPFLWIFAAKGFACVWGASRRWVRCAGRVGIILFLVGVFAVLNVAVLRGYRTIGTAHDTAVAVENIVPVIRKDYLGPATQPAIKRSLREYYTGKRPLVSSPYGAVGWALRGDACGATGNVCPYPEDYLFLPLGSGYKGITQVDARVYTYVARVRGGLGRTWALFRRRTTPGRKE